MTDTQQITPHPEKAPFPDGSFTPGPWLMELDNFGDYTVVQQGSTLAIAAVVNGEMRRMGGQSAEHEANANLIIAAPDMFGACDALCRAFPETDSDNSIESLWARYGSELALAVQSARQALSKATGGQHV